MTNGFEVVALWCDAATVASSVDTVLLTQRSTIALFV